MRNSTPRGLPGLEHALASGSAREDTADRVGRVTADARIVGILCAGNVQGLRFQRATACWVG
ncbi:hypothetical protein AB0K53_16910 [Streptomyces tuirus]|uniref:hypothetical protein n=1 Tax=Streptomyces tuirus TaxID=68278 RepID=UPI003414017C